MRDQTSNTNPPQRGSGSSATAASRQDKRAEALRRNLLRRKQADAKTGKRG